jgi:hypothetical protein
MNETRQPVDAPRRTVKALTISQPWAWAIIHAGKNVENRRWKTRYRGPLLIHAGNQSDPAGSGSILWVMDDPEAFGQPRAAFEARGAIIGVANLVDVLIDSSSPWAMPGWFHWLLEFPEPVDPPIPCRGRQGLWRPPPRVLGTLAGIR